MKSVLAIDIGGTFIKYGLIHENYRISNKGKVKTPNTDAPLSSRQVK